GQGQVLHLLRPTLPGGASACERPGRLSRAFEWTRSTLLKIPGQSLLRKCVNTNSAPPLAEARWGADSCAEGGEMDGVFEAVEAVFCFGEASSLYPLVHGVGLGFEPESLEGADDFGPGE